LAGTFIGLAVLTKGPVALLVSGLSMLVYIIVHRGPKGYSWLHLIIIVLIALAVTAIWFGVELFQNGPIFLQEFLSYQAGLFSQNIADHEEPWFYHPIVLLIGCFPASIFLFQYTLRRNINRHNGSDFSRWMWILFWVVLILFSIVKTKIVHYSSLCYYPLTYLAAIQIYRLSEKQIKLKKSIPVLLLLVSSIWGILLTAIPIVGVYKSAIIPLVQDPFAVGNLQATVSWSLAESLFGLLYLGVIGFSVFLLKRNFTKGISLMALAQILMIQITMLHFTPKIEAYSQRAAIEFYQNKIGQDVYVQVLGFRSYAHLFYTQKQASKNENYYSQDWLLTGKVDKPTFFVAKVQDADQYRKLATLKVLYEKNGFVFFQRIL
jgi:4-amino-4-deoxy-L-arabinose transferase-like glycosyltransferase